MKNKQIFRTNEEKRNEEEKSVGRERENEMSQKPILKK